MTVHDPEAPISIFTPAEIEYLKSQRLCRIATADASGQPHVTPVAFRYDADTDTFIIGGHGDFTQRKKWRDVEQNPQVAIVFDDIATVSPWKVRGMEVRGVAETSLTGGEVIGNGFGSQMFRITPKRIVSWGLDTDAYASQRTFG